MEDYRTAIQHLGRDNITATFGVAPPAEIVQLNPRSVYYGQVFGYDESAGRVAPEYAIPLIMFEFNKYRPDLPPWENVREFVLAAMDDGEVVEYTFIEPHHRSTAVTGGIKTVSLTAEGPSEGVDGAIIERAEVAEKRDMTESNLRDTSEFKVNEELF
jgi:hypothetical protein